MKFDELLVFRNDLYFEGAVQADWFYKKELVEKVAKSFVFHGPSTHAVSAEEVGNNNLMDTASFVKLLADRFDTSEENMNPLLLAIAGYGTGKSHLAVALSELLSGKDFDPDTFNGIIANLRRADASIASEVERKLKKPNLVLTLNGVNNFDLHYELLRTAQKAMKVYHVSDEVIRSLDQAHETALIFLNKNYEIMTSAFEKAAEAHDIFASGYELRNYLNDMITSDDRCFECINDVYFEINGHKIRWDEGVSAKQILNTLVSECCGNHGKFDHVVILFDEFGRFLEYASANPGRAGDSALQQIFEAAQNAEGVIQFVGFIQADIKAYLQRVDKSSNISRYIDRFDASEKVYLSSNLETIFANLIDVKDQSAYRAHVGGYFDRNKSEITSLHQNMLRWVRLKGIWNNVRDFDRIICRDLYPLHPISTYLLITLTDWLQNRSSLTLLNEKFREMSSASIEEGKDIPIIYPTDLLKGNFFTELLNAEEQGRQRSQICILYNAIYTRFNQKLSEDEKAVLLANVILRICRFKNTSRSDTVMALAVCANLTIRQVESALRVLEDEYAVMEYDERIHCFDFIADAVGAGEFRTYIRKKRSEIHFSADILSQNEVISASAQITEPIQTVFSDELGIQTFEWAFEQHIIPIERLDDSLFDLYIKKWTKATSTNTPKGILLWAYYNKETSAHYIDDVVTKVNHYCTGKPIVVFALNDIENKLKDAVVDYLAYTRADNHSRERFARFFDEGLKKSIVGMENQFDELKRERIVFGQNGLEPTNTRMAIYLSDIFEAIYPNAIPFDFEGFNKKTTTRARKNYAAVTKTLVSGEGGQVFKVQGGELKSRFDSVLRYGEYAWRAVNEEYIPTEPRNKKVLHVYHVLEKMFNDNSGFSFGDAIEMLYKPPYGLNEYSAVLLLSLLSYNLGYCSRLELENSRYNTAAWASQVIGETKIDLPRITATFMKKVDVAAASQRYMILFKKVEDTKYLTEIDRLRTEIEGLMKEEYLPDTLKSQYKLTDLKLRAARKAEIGFDQKIGEVVTRFYKGQEREDIYSCILALKDALDFHSITSCDGFTFEVDESTAKELSQIKEKAKVYIEGRIDAWLMQQRCRSIDEIQKFEGYMRKLSKILDDLGYVKQARITRSILERESTNLAIIKKRSDFAERCDKFVSETASVNAKKPLELLEQWNAEGKLVEEEYFSFGENDLFDAQLKKYQAFSDRLTVIRELIQNRRNAMQQIWDDLYDTSSINVLRKSATRISSLLESGIPKQDRDDFENILNFVKEFIFDYDRLAAITDDRGKVNRIYDELVEKYSSDEAELDFIPVLDSLFTKRIEDMDKSEAYWVRKNLDINFERKDIDYIDAWMKNTADLPKCLSDDTLLLVKDRRNEVKQLMSQKRVQYVAKLYRKLTKEEKQQVKELLGLD